MDGTAGTADVFDIGKPVLDEISCQLVDMRCRGGHSLTTLVVIVCVAGSVSM